MVETDKNTQHIVAWISYRLFSNFDVELPGSTI